MFGRITGNHWYFGVAPFQDSSASLVGIEQPLEAGSIRVNLKEVASYHDGIHEVDGVDVECVSLLMKSGQKITVIETLDSIDDAIEQLSAVYCNCCLSPMEIKEFD